MSAESKRPRSVSDDRILDALEATPDPVATAKELSSELPIGDRHLRDRLLELVDAGKAHTKKVGPSRIYWIDIDHSIERFKQSTMSSAVEDEDVDRLQELVDELEIPGDVEARRELMVDVLELIRDRGGATKSEILGELVDDDVLETVDYASNYSVWKHLIQVSLSHLAKTGFELESPGSGGDGWIWRD